MRTARIRPTESEALPGANGTTMVTGRDGQACAIADDVATATVTAAIARRRMRRFTNMFEFSRDGRPPGGP